MSFHDCCCGKPPPFCDCACVCTYPWYITNPFKGDFEGDEKYIGIFREGPLVGLFGLGEWTLLWWSDGCSEQSEDGWIYNLVEDARLPEAELEIWIGRRPGPAPNPIGLNAQSFARSVDDPVAGPKAQFSVFIEYPIAAAGCKMYSLRYRRVNFPDPECDHLLVPELKPDLWTPTGGHYDGNPNTPPFIDCVGIGDSDKALMGANATSYIGNAFPLDDPRFENFSTLEPYFNGCISMFTVYDRYLPDIELEDMWNSGQGKLPTNAYEYWCARNPPWQDTPGQLRNIMAEHIGAVWDQDGDHILDGQGKRIHGIAGQG